MPDHSRAVLDRPFARYAMTLVIVAASFALRYFMVQYLGLEFHTFITFYPAILLVAILAGFWPGILATALVVLGINLLLLPPIGSFTIANPSDALALALFTAICIFFNMLIERFRCSERLIAAYKSEQAQWESKAKLDVALASMTDAVFISDTSGQFIQFNDAFATFCRFRNKAECSRKLSELREFLDVLTVDGELVPLDMRPIPRALRGETATNAEYSLRRKDTGETWLADYSFAPLRDSLGAIVGSLVVARDITERKRAEAAVLEREKQFHTLANSIPQLCWMANADGWIFWYNQRWYEYTGTTPEQMEGWGWQSLHDPDALPMVLEKWKNSIATGKIFEMTFSLRGADGAFRSFLTRVVPLEDANGKVERWFGTNTDITEQKKLEQALQQSMEQLQIFVEYAPAALAMFDSEMRYLCASRRWLADYGLGDRDLRGLSHYEIFPEISGDWKEAHRRGLAGEVVRKEADCFHRANGASQWLTWEIHPWRDLSGGIGGIVVFTKDITERKRAEEHIRQLNRVYAVLSDINQTIVREKDSQAMLEAACRIAVDKGKFRMAWIGMADPATHLLKPVASSGFVDDYLDQIRIDLLEPNTATGPAAHSFHSGEHSICNDIEHELYRQWKSHALEHGYRSLAAFPLRCEGRIVGVFSFYASELGFFVEDETKLLDEMAMDISFALEVNRREESRRRAEEELRWRTAFFEAQVDCALDGMLVVDNQGKKILQNRQLNDLLKIPKDVSENTDDAQQANFVMKLMKYPGEFEEKVNYLNSHPDEVSRDEIELLDGSILDRYSSPVKDKFDNYYGRIWTFRDITERRQLEDQFRQAQKMEAVGQLTGGIAHDFNNLLTVILGCSEVIGEKVIENPQLGKMADMISDAARRGAELTHRMLAFARRQTLQPKLVNINRLLVDIQSFLRRTMSADINVSVIQSGEDCEALVDLTQLESALLNLCLNARDAMPNGGTLTIETGNTVLDSDYADQNPEVTPGQYILVAVTDTGCGISPENLSRVFEPFFTTKEVGKGTGLGLSMVYGFIKQSQGHVKIYSEPGQGTSVKLYLPKSSQKGEPFRQDQMSVADLRGSEVVLLVEDNAPVREFAKSQLVSLGYQVLEAANGKDALKILGERADVDLLFTDIIMPGGMNGRELGLEACRIYPKLKVLYCSGYAENAILHEGLLDKDVQFLSKPYTRRELAAKIRRVLTGNQIPFEGE